MNNNYKKDKGKLVIMGYHKVGFPPAGGWETWLYVPEKVFTLQLNYLKENGWQVISAEAFKQAIDHPRLLAEKTALITFDDGYRSNLEIAAPILQRYNYPAVAFVPTAFVGTYNAFDADIFYEPKEPICSWEELKQLDEKGISIQSHGITHRHFSQLSQDVLRNEIIESKACLEEKLSKTIDMFSFPYGDNGLYQPAIKV